MDDLSSKEPFDFIELLIEMFLHRPYLSNSKPDSEFMSNLDAIETFYLG